MYLSKVFANLSNTITNMGLLLDNLDLDYLLNSHPHAIQQLIEQTVQEVDESSALSCKPKLASLGVYVSLATIIRNKSSTSMVQPIVDLYAIKSKEKRLDACMSISEIRKTELVPCVIMSFAS